MALVIQPYQLMQVRLFCSCEAKQTTPQPVWCGQWQMQSDCSKQHLGISNCSRSIESESWALAIANVYAIQTIECKLECAGA